MLGCRGRKLKVAHLMPSVKKNEGVGDLSESLTGGQGQGSFVGLLHRYGSLPLERRSNNKKCGLLLASSALASRVVDSFAVVVVVVDVVSEFYWFRCYWCR